MQSVNEAQFLSNTILFVLFGSRSAGAACLISILFFKIMYASLEEKELEIKKEIKRNLIFALNS